MGADCAAACLLTLMRIASAGQLHLDGKVTVYAGDCLDVVRTLPDGSVDSVVTDPPYALVSIVKRFGKEGAAPALSNGATGVYGRASSGFMGKAWDTGERAFAVEFWAEVYRILKPGGHVLAFAGTRTYHRLACAIEDASFEVRDQIGWAFGQGFPKSHNVGNGWGTALKPAWEPICMARKPLGESTVAGNVLKHGCGALNIDGCRVGTSDADKAAINAKHAGMNVDEYERAAGVSLDLSVKPMALIPAQAHTLGRWPANLLHDGSDEVVAAFPEAGGGFGKRGGQRDSEYGFGGSMETVGYGDSGSAARFFYSAKADAQDRLGSKHPTVKPISLLRWLARLVTPPGGLILDPFAGTGTLGEAAYYEGFRATLIEREAEYCEDIARRMHLVLAGPDERARESLKARGKADYDAGPLFGVEA